MAWSLTRCVCVCVSSEDSLSRKCVLIRLSLTRCWHAVYEYVCPHIGLVSDTLCMCMCVLIRLSFTRCWHAVYVCPHKTLILLHMCPCTTKQGVSRSVTRCWHVCVLILLYVCPHATIFVSLYGYSRGCHALPCAAGMPYICVLILLYMCPHTTIYVSSYYYVCVLILP